MACPPLPPNSHRFMYANGLPLWMTPDGSVISLEPVDVHEKAELLEWHPVIASDGFRLWMEQCMLDAHKPTMTAFLTWAKEGFCGDTLDRASVKQSLGAAEAWMSWRPK